MALRTRLFGKKIERLALEKLLEEMGYPHQGILGNDSLRERVYGKCSLIPTEDGISVDLYVVRKPNPEISDGVGWGENNTILRKKDRNKTIHLTVIIPYSGAIAEGQRRWLTQSYKPELR